MPARFCLMAIALPSALALMLPLVLPLPGLVVPLDERGDLRVPYRLDRKAFASISASDVLKGAGDLSMLKGTVVLIGATIAAAAGAPAAVVFVFPALFAVVGSGYGPAESARLHEDIRIASALVAVLPSPVPVERVTLPERFARVAAI